MTSKRVARSGDVEVPDDEESSEDWMIGVDRGWIPPRKLQQTTFLEPFECSDIANYIKF